MKNMQLGEPIVNNIFNMSVNEARAYLEENGFTMRVISVDGRAKGVSMELKEKRVNVFVKDGKIDDINNIS
tara:strand:- start:42589 stop:42801 length:213 start_codon:yes stop_codon:yes gene_type:complete